MNRTLKATAVLMLMMVFAAGCTKPNEPNNVSGNYNGHDYVDLGLPSGTLWATCNIGATTPEGYGDYFAWGETEPKDYYEWSTYKYCNEGNWTGLTKYCSSNSFGYLHFIDDLTVLEAVDDAATANWGSGWCMPTEDQWEELCQNTSNSWTTQNGINGRLFTASNGNTLFLPAAGNRWESNTNLTTNNGDSGFGNYWSNSLYLRIPDGAIYFQFRSEYFKVFYDARSRGCSVRAVCSAAE